MNQVSNILSNLTARCFPNQPPFCPCEMTRRVSKRKYWLHSFNKTLLGKFNQLVVMLRTEKSRGSSSSSFDPAVPGFCLMRGDNPL